MLIYLNLIADPQGRQNFEELYTRYQALLFYVASRILDNEKDAEDAVHNAFVSVAQNMDRVSALDPSQRKAIDHQRSRSRRPTVALAEETVGLTVRYPEENGLARCMLKLPARDRQFVLLKFDQGYTTKEIADMMGLTLAAARKVEQRAKARLETLCREEGLL